MKGEILNNAAKKHLISRTVMVSASEIWQKHMTLSLIAQNASSIMSSFLSLKTVDGDLETIKIS